MPPGHYLAAAIGLSILEKGGNAVDAGVAAGFAVALLKPQSVGIGGEVPILIHLADRHRSVAINGQGWAPRAATVDWFRQHGVSLIPSDGFLPATVPGAIRFVVHGPAAVRDVLSCRCPWPRRRSRRRRLPRLRRAPQCGRQGQRPLRPRVAHVGGGVSDQRSAAERGRAVPQSRLGTHDEGCAIDASVFRAAPSGREAGIDAALEYFYSGPVAEQAVKFSSSHAFVDDSGSVHTGLFTLEDFADYGARGTSVEDPVRVEYRGVEVLKCGPWSQGPVLLQQLRLLEGFDWRKLGHNTADYLHVYLEASKLAFADRERYYGDPEFVSVPLGLLLSEDYAAERRELIDPRHASLELRPGSLAVAAPPSSSASQRWPVVTGDTTHVDAVDRWGNLFAATPSGGWIGSSPVVEGLGFPLGTRGQMFYLDEKHANALLPMKRPRTTLTPSMALRDGQPWMAFGTPGGDQQDQWTLQFFLNVVDFGMELQEALDAPTVQSTHFPGSFYPHAAQPGGVQIESRIDASVRNELAARGHVVGVDGAWSHGQVTAVARERNGVLSGAASPRGRVAYVMGR